MGRSDLQVFQDVLQYQYCHDGNQEHDRHQSGEPDHRIPDTGYLRTLTEPGTEKRTETNHPDHLLRTVLYVKRSCSQPDSVLFSANGLVNHAVMGAGGKAIMFTSLPEYFRKLFIGSNIWQTMGFNAIIFIAALTAISPEYYEAATMDGASRFQKILYIDLPLIMPTIILMLILQVGNIMNVGYEKAYLMQNGTNTTVSEIISTYVYKVGLQTAQYSFATAVGLFNSVVNFIILVITNAVAKKTSDISIF